MFPWQLILISIITVFAVILIVQLTAKRNWVLFEKIAFAIAFVACGYCFLAGLFMLNDWHDPLAAASPEEVGRAAGTHGGRGGIIVLVIRFWPYALMAFGGYFGYMVAGILKHSIWGRAPGK